MRDLLHFSDLCEIAIEAGLADIDDATAWLEARGLCVLAIDQYAGHMIDAALDSDHDLRMRLEGMFTTGLTLGVAIGESVRESARAKGAGAEVVCLKCKGAGFTSEGYLRDVPRECDRCGGTGVQTVIA